MTAAPTTSAIADTASAAVIERAAPCSPLTCPFCGEVPQYLATGSVSHPDIIVRRFLCISGSCGVQPFSGWHLTAEEAVSVWNKRSPANDELCGGASPSASASGSLSDFTKD